LSSRIGRAIATFNNFYVLHSSATSFFNNWQEIIYLFCR